MNAWLSNRDHADEATSDERPSWPNVAGTVLRSTRLSAGVSSAQLAAGVGVDEQTILAWERGAEPLASVPVNVVETLKDTLRTAGGDEQLVADLDAAAWCDVVLGVMATHADVSCLLADPLAGERAFGELLSWAVSGNVPPRYAEVSSDVVR